LAPDHAEKWGAEGVRGTLPSKDVAAHLHFVIDVYDIAAPETERTSRSLLPDAVYDWLQQEGSREVGVYGIREFARSAFEPVVSAPFDVSDADLGPFNAVTGLVLAKYGEAGRDDSLLYEAQIRLLREVLSVQVSFVAPFSGDADSLSRLMKQAAEIASFAIRPKSVQEPAK
jgi:hypothetical protein